MNSVDLQAEHLRPDDDAEQRARSTTTGTTTPRPAAIAASVPASADAPTMARNVAGSTWIR